MNEIECACGTHAGLVRDNNEDSYLAKPDIGLWAIADGMGGHGAGEVASGIVITELVRSIGQGSELIKAIESAHCQLQAAAENGVGSPDMGSTVVALKLDGLSYEIAWVGDSRAYLWNGALHQLTKDHSYVQLLLDAGLISEKEIPQHPHRNVIYQGLGVGGSDNRQVKVDLATGKLSKNDSLLLCSDGLTGEVSEKVIASILAGSANNKTKVDGLIRVALESGGQDNITVIIISPAASS